MLRSFVVATLWIAWQPGCSKSQPEAEPTAVPVTPTAPTATKIAKRAKPSQLTKITLKALRMTCPESCPIGARSALAKIAQVYQVGVDIDHEAVFVAYDSSLGPPKQAAEPMLAELRRIGFDPWFKAEGWPDSVTDRDVVILDEGPGMERTSERSERGPGGDAESKAHRSVH